MINKLLPILSLALLCFILHEQSLKPFSFHKRPKSQLRGAPAVYQALITGNKSGVPRKTIDTMKTFGLMHLLTPSGLHLGSFLLLFKCFPKFKFLITLLMFLGSFSIPGFLALKRMLVFYLVNFRLKNIQLSFIATFILSLLIGNYAESPMSFAFTFIFWGCIIFNTGGKWALAKKLFVLQAAVAILFHQQINLVALILNPVITLVFSLCFPILLFLYPWSFLKPTGLFFVEFFTSFIDLLNYFSLLNMPGEMAILIVFCFSWRRKLAISALLLILSPSLDMQPSKKRPSPHIHYPLPRAVEFLKTNKRKIEFIDRLCRVDFEGKISCKKKPSRLGGPHI